MPFAVHAPRATTGLHCASEVQATVLGTQGLSRTTHSRDEAGTASAHSTCEVAALVATAALASAITAPVESTAMHRTLRVCTPVPASVHDTEHELHPPVLHEPTRHASSLQAPDVEGAAALASQRAASTCTPEVASRHVAVRVRTPPLQSTEHALQALMRHTYSGHCVGTAGTHARVDTGRAAASHCESAPTSPSPTRAHATTRDCTAPAPHVALQSLVQSDSTVHANVQFALLAAEHERCTVGALSAAQNERSTSAPSR